MTAGGKPTLDEILASIRRITAEESAQGFDPARTEAARVLPPLIASRLFGGPDDFQLPAMFLQDRTPTEPPPSKAEHVSPRQIEQAPLVPRMGLEPASSLRPPRLDADDVPRQMPSCLDRTLMRMGQHQAPKPKPPAAVRSAVNGSVPKGTLRTNYLVGEGSLVDSEPGDASGPAGGASPMQGDGDPADRVPTRFAEGADLLRPMLRQWLDENIKRVFAQALTDTARGKQLEVVRAALTGASGPAAPST